MVVGAKKKLHDVEWVASFVLSYFQYYVVEASGELGLCIDLMKCKYYY